MREKIEITDESPPIITEAGSDERSNPEKTAVECICPKCGDRHTLNFHWIGRGTPRKYCPVCKNIL